jgi:hypothetical protein
MDDLHANMLKTIVEWSSESGDELIPRTAHYTRFEIVFYLTSIMLGHFEALQQLYKTYNVEFNSACLEAAITVENYECLLFISNHTTERLSDDFMVRVLTQHPIKNQMIAEWLVDEMRTSHRIVVNPPLDVNAGVSSSTAAITSTTAGNNIDINTISPRHIVDLTTTNVVYDSPM